MPSVRRSLLLSLADSYLGLVLQLAATVIVSRLLMPAEVGVFAIAAVFAAVAGTVRDFGVGEYLIQERKLSRQHIRAALALNIIVSWGMALLLVAAAPLAADFYREPGVARVMAVQALGLLLVPFGAVIHAWFRRELDYRPIVIGNALSNVASFIATVSLALLGFGYMSLAWASVASNLVMIVVAQVYRPTAMPYRPSLRGARRIVNFGVTSSSAYMITDATQGAPDLVMGRTIGMEAVAIFGRASGLVQMFDKAVMNAVWRVAMPYFSMRDREGGDVTTAFLKASAFTTALAWPFFLFLALMAFAVIRIMFGTQWDASVPLVPYLCAAGAIGGPFTLTWSVLIATGQLGRIMRPLLLTASVQVAALVVASHWGVEAVAQSFVGSGAFAAAVWYRTLRRTLGFSGRGFVGALAKSAGVTVCAGVVPVIVAAVIPPAPGNLWPPLLIGGAGAALGWLGGVVMLHHPFRDELANVLARIRRRAAR